VTQILTSLHGRKLGLGPSGELIAPNGIVTGAHGSQFFLPSPGKVVMFDDFLGDVVADQWNFTEGTDSTTSDGAIVEGVNGVYRLTPGDSAGTVAADGAQLNSALNWKVGSGLVFETRICLASIVSVSCFVGLTDTKSLEQPIYSAASADTITTDATDAVGLFFDTAMSTDNWWLAGVANDVDATKLNTGFAPVASTYETFRLEIDSAGKADLYRNGAYVGSITSAVRTTIALTPVWITRPLSAAAGKTMDIDYALIAADRV
jgi:hypothetical protein